MRYIVTVTIIPLKGCQKYGYMILNHQGSNGATVVKYGIIDTLEFMALSLSLNTAVVTADSLNFKRFSERVFSEERTGRM